MSERIHEMPFEDQPVDPTHAENHKADMAWSTLRARQGWPDATLIVLLNEFIRKEHLSVRLLAFMRSRGYK